MRIQRQKRLRKIVRFYCSCFGFRQPFKVLCDGTFLHHLVTNGVDDGVDFASVDKALYKLLSANVKPFTTRCAVAELKHLGKPYSKTLQLARSLATARCNHGTKSAVDCFVELVGESNQEHFFVGTLDQDMHRKLEGLPGVPIIKSLKNSLILEKPSDSQHVFLRKEEEGRLHMTDREHRILDRKAVQSSETQTTGYDRREYTTRKADRAQFRRKKAKGPNPLSCLKKKKKKDGHQPGRKVNQDT